jgi:hypothetical protein
VFEIAASVARHGARVERGANVDAFLKNVSLCGQGVPGITGKVPKRPLKVDGNCAADYSLLNLPKGKSLGRSKPATNS